MPANQQPQTSPHDEAIAKLQTEQRQLRADIETRKKKAAEQGEDGILMAVVAGAGFAADLMICGGLFTAFACASGGSYLHNQFKQAGANKRIRRIDAEIDVIHREKLREQTRQDLNDVLKQGGQPLENEFDEAARKKAQAFDETLRQQRDANGPKKLDSGPGASA